MDKRLSGCSTDDNVLCNRPRNQHAETARVPTLLFGHCPQRRSLHWLPAACVQIPSDLEHRTQQVLCQMEERSAASQPVCEGTSIGKIKPEEMKKRIDHFETMLKLTSIKNFKPTDGFKGILPDLNLAMHELPERPAAPKRAADFKQTEFETLLDQTERKPIISNYHLTKAVETADVELRIPSAVGKFARAVVLGRMHARKHHFVPDWHWIWMDKYLEKSDFIA